MSFPARFQQIFLQRVGVVNSYDDDIRTYVENGYQQNPVVYAIVNNIAKNAGRAKWCIKNSKGEVIDVPLLSQLLVQPNALQSWTDLVQDLVTHKILEGNMFITGEFGSGINGGKYTNLYSLPSEDMQIIASNDFRGIKGYRVDFAWAENTMIPASDVLHLRNPNPDFDETDNWLFGQSAFRAARTSIQTLNESIEAGNWFIQNKGAQKILFNKNDMYDLSPEAQDQLKSKLRASGQGPKNNGNIPIVDGADLSVLDVSSNAKDALVLEQQHQAALYICNVVNFPPQLLGLTQATYQNAKEAKKMLWENCIIPELDELKDGLNRWLAPQFGDVYIDYKVDHIDALQEDKLMRGKAIKEFAGMVTVNEARKMAGLPEMEGPEGEEMYAGFTQAVVDNTSSSSDDEQKYDDWWDNAGD